MKDLGAADSGEPAENRKALLTRGQIAVLAERAALRDGESAEETEEVDDSRPALRPLGGNNNQLDEDDDEAMSSTQPPGRPETFNFTPGFQDAILACLIRHPDEFRDLGDCIKPAYFTGPAASELVFRLLECRKNYGNTPSFETLANFAFSKAKRANPDHATKLHEYVVKLSQIDTSDRAVHLDLVEAFIKERALQAALVKIVDASQEGKLDEISPIALITEAMSAGEQSLTQRLFNPDIEPPPLRPVYTLAGTCICTPGNLTTITSTIKTGKSACIGAMAASAMPCTGAADLLSFSSSNPQGHALLWFDSEQSPDDYWHQVYRALKRAGLTKPPPWFYGYCLTGLGWQRAWNTVLEVLRVAAEKHGGVHSVLLDGAADFVSDVNDAEASNAFVASLHGLAIRHYCPIIGVIHFNPGGDKTRGHLGSQMERKAETNLRLDKSEDEITVVWSNKQRRAPILKKNGPRFRFCKEAGMHISVSDQTYLANKEDNEKEQLSGLVDKVFIGQTALRYSALRTAIESKSKASKSTAERKIKQMVQLGLIKSEGKRYIRTT